MPADPTQRPTREPATLLRSYSRRGQTYPIGTNVVIVSEPRRESQLGHPGFGRTFVTVEIGDMRFEVVLQDLKVYATRKRTPPNEFHLFIKLGNDGMYGPHDVATALRGVAVQIEDQERSGIVIDINNNEVGAFEVKYPTEEQPGRREGWDKPDDFDAALGEGRR